MQEVLERYPGFTCEGLKIPPQALSQCWTVPELELYCGSLGQLWPHGRARPVQSGRSRGAPGGGTCGGAGAEPRVPLAKMRPYLRVLELQEGAPPDLQVLKRAYRRMALLWHPDKNAGVEAAAGKFHAVSEAYENLLKWMD